MGPEGLDYGMTRAHLKRIRALEKENRLLKKLHFLVTSTFFKFFKKNQDQIGNNLYICTLKIKEYLDGNK